MSGVTSTEHERCAAGAMARTRRPTMGGWPTSMASTTTAATAVPLLLLLLLLLLQVLTAAAAAASPVAAPAPAPNKRDGRRALIVVDMQRCFLPGGTLALPGMSAAAAGDLVAKVRALARSGGYGAVAWTQDWHPRGHVSFARTHGKRAFADAVDLRYAAGGRVCGLGSLFPNSTATCAAAAAAAGGTGGNGGSSSSSSGSSGSGSGGAKAGSGAQSGAGQAPAPVVASVHQALWPEHCVAGTADAALAPGLAPRPGDIVVRKGSRPSLDAYSAFFDNAHLWASGLAAALRRRGVGSVTIAGVALDYCVRATALDAVGEGFATRVVLDATAPVSAAAAPAVERELRARGVEIVTAAQEAAEAAALAAAAGKTKAAAAATPAAAG